MKAIEEFTVTLKYQVIADTETGEVETKCISKKIDKKETTSKASSKATLTLEENKYRLNQAAIDLMGVEPDCKIDIKYEKRGKNTVPVIGSDEAFGTKGGNKLTKSLTVACRGSRNEELSKYGNVFTIIPHETKEGLFILDNGNLPKEEEEEDIDIDLSIIDADVEEIDSNNFKFTL